MAEYHRFAADERPEPSPTEERLRDEIAGWFVLSLAFLAMLAGFVIDHVVPGTSADDPGGAQEARAPPAAPHRAAPREVPLDTSTEPNDDERLSSGGGRR